MGRFVHFDIMQGDRYVCTMHMPHCRAFKLSLPEVKTWIEKKRPSLLNKQYEVYFD